VPTIEVTCECGRVYVLPSEKEGRKLQCRRCGAVVTVRRDVVPGVVVPFQSPGDEADDEQTKPKFRVGEAPLELRPLNESGVVPPLRKCPGCGFRDDPTIVICVRCGLDFRDPAPRPKTQKRAKPEALAREREQDERVSRIETLGKLSFVPVAGILMGALAMLLSLSGNGPIAELPAPSRKSLETRLGTARLMAVATFIIWAGVIGFYLLVYRPQQRHDIRENLAQGCRSHLESLGEWLRESRAAKGRFPANPSQTLAEGIRNLADEHGGGDAVLSCPLLGGERYAIDPGLAAIGSRTTDDYLIVWDSVPHGEPDGHVTWYALRADGRVEAFRTNAEFEQARARPSEKPRLQEATSPPPARHTPQQPSPAEQGFEALAKAIHAAARALEKQDPKLEKLVSLADLESRAGAPLPDAFQEVMRYGDDDLKRDLSFLVARLDVPGPEMLRFASPLAREADADARWALVRGLRRVGAPAWIDLCGSLATDAVPPASDDALALLAAEAKKGKDELRRVLLCARERRAGSKVPAEQPVFQLPAAVYASSAALLSDPEVGAEALAILGRGGQEVEDVLDPVFKAPDPRVREAAFKALRRNLDWNNASRAPLHARLHAEADRGVRAAVLETLLESVDAPSVERSLEALRDTESDALSRVASKVLALNKDKDGFALMVRELERAGPARDEVVADMRRPQRIVDEDLSQVLNQKAPLLDAVGQETAVSLAALRFDDASNRFLLREAASAASSSVRDLAWKALADGAGLSDKVRTEVQEALVARLSKETEPSVRVQLLSLLERPEYRSSSAILALEQLARRATEKDDMRERAAGVLGLFNDMKAVNALVDLVDSTSGHPKYFLTLKLKDLTTPTAQAQTTIEWRRIVQKADAEIKKKLKDREDRDRADLKTRQERAQEHVKELRARSS
jgi:hypothetical protein